MPKKPGWSPSGLFLCAFACHKYGMSLLTLLNWLAFPVYVWQGLSVRRRVQRMLPAEGPVIHRIAGEGEPINLLVLGDSSAASVGVESSERGLAARIAHRAH